MKSWLCRVLLVQVLLLAVTAGAYTAGCGFAVEKVTRVTNSGGKSQTARDNARCITVDPSGVAHMVWVDDKDGNPEIYYASIAGEVVSPVVRITRSDSVSSFPCIASEGSNVYILWRESLRTSRQIFYVRLVGGQEVARKQITNAALGAGCPVASVGPDKALHIAWHQGAPNMTAVYYGKIVGDSLVTKTGLCTSHPAAFRPDIACDSKGKVLAVWYEGLDIKSRLWDGTAWQPETLVKTNHNRSWRLSLANISEGKWGLAWFDQAPMTSDVQAMFYDGKAWSGETRVNTGQIGFYPAAAGLGGGGLLVAWEDQDKKQDSVDYLLMMRCYDGLKWGEPIEIARGSAMSRYCSLAPAGSVVHAVWFSPAPGNDEIFYGLLRRK